jgi:hypothetical protein
MQTFEFDTVFNEWVKESGGKSEVIKIVRSSNRLQLENLPVLFILYFQDKYNVVMPEETDTIFQPNLYEVDFYITRINRLIADHESRPTSGSNVMFIILVVLIVLGLLSFCN